MAAQRCSPALCGLAVLAAMASLMNLAFVPTQRAARSSVAMRAAEEHTEVKEEEKSFSMPRPDLGLLNKQSQEGQTYDQDKRGNVWAVTRPSAPKEEAEALPAAIYIPFVIMLTIVAIIFFAQQTGNDPNFGGPVGDGSLPYGN